MCVCVFLDFCKHDPGVNARKNLCVCVCTCVCMYVYIYIHTHIQKQKKWTQKVFRMNLSLNFEFK